MTPEKINELKVKYGKIFKVTINNQDWFYRAMTRPEFKKYSVEQSANAENVTQLDLEDMIFDICNLNDIKSADIKEAGIVTIVADAIMKATGFSDEIVPEEL